MKLLHTIVTIGLTFITSSEVLAAPAEFASSVIGEFEEDAESPSESSEEDLEAEGNSDLLTTQGERRVVGRHAVLLTLGESSPWNSVGLRAMRWHHQTFASSLSLGSGRFHQVASSGVHDVTTTSNNIGFRSQWWPSENFPLAIVGDVGLHKWGVKTKCITGGSTGQCTDGKWTATGGSMAAGVMLSWLSEDQVMIEWTILSVKTSSPWKQSWDGRDGSSGEAEAREFVQKRSLLNVANFSMGLYF